PRPIRRSNSLGYVTSVYVAPEWRNGGLGSRLLAAAVADARETGHASLFLWPRERSIPFYRRAGFVPSTELHELPLAGGRQGLAPERQEPTESGP
ncbi:MAG: GNAT family N-acetyltransferase, partial [Candidatus Limnocylindria bacterium]